METRSHRNQGHSELEWSWNKDIQEILKSSIRVHGNNVTFHPNYSSGTSAVVGDTPLRRGQQHYWEIEFTSHVYGTDVMVGLATRKLDLASHCHSFASFLGHDTSSWGFSYHGKIQHAGSVTRYGEKWARGDVIGLHVDTWRGHVYCYKNGKPLGLAFDGLQGLDLYPVVSSTAAKSEVRLKTALSLPSSLKFECYRKLAEKWPKSDLLNMHLPPGLRNFVLNNYWFLDCLAPSCIGIVDESPPRELLLQRTRNAGGRGTKTKRNYTKEAQTSDSSGSDDECFLNIKSKKLALMRKHKASLQSPRLASPAPSCSHHSHHRRDESLAESPPCTSQDINFQRSFSEAAAASKPSSTKPEGNDREQTSDIASQNSIEDVIDPKSRASILPKLQASLKSSEITSEQRSSDDISTKPLVKKRFTLSSRTKK